MMCGLKIPPPEAVTPTTPLRLKVIAAIAYPDGSIGEYLSPPQTNHQR